MPTNYERAFEEWPEVLAAWGELNGAIRAGMDLRHSELDSEPREALVVGRPIATPSA